MSNWRKFEQSCTDYLNRTFGQYANFTCCGGSDSSTSDIKVTTKTGQSFYIEAKDCPAQCGQFVLLQNDTTRTFDYSPRNTAVISPYSMLIINHMNSFFDDFKDAGTTGKIISFSGCSDVFTSWIIQTCKEKGVRFIITNGNIILPIDRFANCFDITAKYRVKRSGSKEIGVKRLPDIWQYVKENYSITRHTQNAGKLLVSSKNNLHNQRFIFAGSEYMFSKRDDQYEIRQLSKTFNANVIFSITLKPQFNGLTNQDFSKLLRM